MIKKVIKKSINNGVRTEKRHLNYLYLLDWVRKNCKINTVDVSSNLRVEYIGDFNGLLLALHTNPKLQYINTLLNDISSSSEYDAQATTVLVLDETDANINTIMEKLNNV